MKYNKKQDTTNNSCKSVAEKREVDVFVLTVQELLAVQNPPGCMPSIDLVIAGASLLPWAHRCTGSAGYWLALLTTHTLCAQSKREKVATPSVVGAQRLSSLLAWGGKE